MTTRIFASTALFAAAIAAAAFAATTTPATRPTAPSPTTSAKNVSIKRELLAENQTVAQFTALAYQRCMGMTALCPDNCGDSGDFATFQITAYLKYNKLGQYGDDPAKTYTFQVNDNHGTLKIPQEYAAKVRALKPGDYVLVNWNHEYVTLEENGASSSGPERPLTKVEPISKEEADKLVAAAQGK
jgi:hypothetical protein